MTAPTQILPPWLSVSTSFINTGGVPVATTFVVPVPETYYGPSIPLDSAWVYGGSTSPPPGVTSTTVTTSASGAITATPVTATATPGASLVATAAGITVSSAASASVAAAVSASASGTTLPTTSALPTSLTSSIVVSISGPLTGLLPNPTGSLQPGDGIHNGGLSHGAIIALATVFSLFGALLLLFGLFWLVRRSRRRDGTYRNSGRALHGDTSVLPAGPDERGSLLEGRRDGGESPEMRERSATPIADSFISARKRREAGIGGYHALNTGSISGPVGQAFATEQPHAPSHSSHHGSDDTRQTQTASSHAMFGQGSNSTHNIPPSPTSPMLEHDSEEAAELVTAQRATRSPLARLARFSWFARNRNTVSTSMAATAGTDEEYLAVGRNTPLDSRRHSASAVPGRQPPGEPIMASRRSGSVTAIVSPPTPPPTSYLRPPEAELGGLSRRLSGKTNQSSEHTAFHTAPSRPLSQFDSLLDPRYSSDHSHELGPAPTSNDFPPVPAGEVPWPRFGGNNSHSENSPETGGSGNSSDPLDLPTPERYKKSSTGSMGRGGAGPSGLAAAWVPGLSPTAQSPPDPISSLEDAPPTSSEEWLRNQAQNPVRSGSNRMTLGPASFVDTPQVVAQPEVASLHGDTHSHYGHSPAGSAHQVRTSFSSERSPQSVSTATNPASTLTPFSTTTHGERARMPSLTAIGGRSPVSQTIASDQTGSGSGTGSASGMSSGGVPAGSESTRATSEYGELGSASSWSDVGSPRRAQPMPFHLPGVAEGSEGSGTPSPYNTISAPPPAPPASPKVEPLSPPPAEPKKSWWRS
ncbi:hypothetical protein FRB97_001470 [Tulasnella sp. 331]|nr:hypothetical protein FRB97_001470 [Tulasnella sp. 331]